MKISGDFEQEVYTIVAQIPAGRVLTYGLVARLLGMPGYARHVGHALCKAPAEIPCHRVVDGTGRTAPGWSAQATLLEAEGVTVKANGHVDLKRSLWEEVR